MAIAVTQPTPGSGIGAGLILYFSGFLAPTGGDWIAVSTTDGINTLSYGSAYIGSTFGSCLLGWVEAPGPGTSFGVPQGGAAPGAAVSVSVFHYDGSNVVVETALISGWVHDPFTGYPSLLGKLVLSGGWGPSQQAELDSILNAVVTTFS